MGAFNIEFEISDQFSQEWLTLEGLVDTGSTYTWVPQDVLERLSIVPHERREFETADGRVIEREMTLARVRINGKVLPTLIVLGDPGDSVLLGVVTLEEFGLGVDTVKRELIRVRGLAMRRSALP